MTQRLRSIAFATLGLALCGALALAGIYGGDGKARASAPTAASQQVGVPGAPAGTPAATTPMGERSAQAAPPSEPERLGFADPAAVKTLHETGVEIRAARVLFERDLMKFEKSNANAKDIRTASEKRAGVLKEMSNRFKVEPRCFAGDLAKQEDAKACGSKLWAIGDDGAVVRARQ